MLFGQHTSLTWNPVGNGNLICLHSYHLEILLLFSCSVMFDSLQPHGLQHACPFPCPSLSLVVCSNICPLSWWCHHTISSSVVLFPSCPESFPASWSFPMSQFFTSSGQSIGASASASLLPMNFQDWFPLGWTDLISLQSLEPSPTPLFKRINSLALSLLYGPTLKSIHDYWENNNFHCTDLCQQSDVSAF